MLGFAGLGCWGLGFPEGHPAELKPTIGFGAIPREAQGN